ncbi:LysR family transcriptional regulator [Actinokineospora sp. HUAS TT18]|uniref:LysR family transcriptional regulator n=1 Tax=Actinokineospora sp. HUAS TT18 TaxID=3447451 RepID=UPI003F524454
MLNLERLRVLHAVCATGSVRGAAAALHVTTSAVSQQVARLEREVGQRLLERDGRGVRPTDAARLLADHAGRLLAQVELIEADLADFRGVITGTVTIGAFATAARGLLPGALRSLREYPDLTVRLAEQEPDVAIAALRRGDLDIAVVQDWAEAPLDVPPDLSARHLFDDALDVALPADHPLADRTSVTLDDLRDEQWISWSEGQICHDWLTATLPDPRIAHTASEHSTQLALVAAGLGAAVIPRLGRETPPHVRFVPIDPEPTRRVFALWRTSAGSRPAIGAVVAALARD